MADLLTLYRERYFLDNNEKTLSLVRVPKLSPPHTNRKYILDITNDLHTSFLVQFTYLKVRQLIYRNNSSWQQFYPVAIMKLVYLIYEIVIHHAINYIGYLYRFILIAIAFSGLHVTFLVNRLGSYQIIYRYWEPQQGNSYFKNLHVILF